MKNHIIYAVLFLCSSITSFAEDDTKSTFRFNPEIEPYIGLNLGATTSLSVPKETEKIYNSNLMFCPVIGVDFTQMFSNHSGVSMGLVFERKGGDSKVDMRNFETEITLAGEGTPTHGYFTGTSENHHAVYYLTIPVKYVYRFNKKWDISGGAYISFALDRVRNGCAYNGKIRTSPLVPAIAVSYSTSEWSDKVPCFDWGIQVGVKRQIWKKLDVMFDLKWGLYNVLNAPESGLKDNVYNLYGGIGLGWRFNDK